MDWKVIKFTYVDIEFLPCCKFSHHKLWIYDKLYAFGNFLSFPNCLKTVSTN